MARKKILFFIVEGVSDHSALASALEQIFNSQQVVVRFTGGDITSDYKTSTQNIERKIVEEIKREMSVGFTSKDFIEVIQLVDTDGVFIPEDNIKDGYSSLSYLNDEIHCDIKAKIINRNNNKAKILNKLISMPKVWGIIPYSVYFFSSNLDHILHNNSNLPEEKKDPLATNFAKRFINNPKGFVDFFSKSSFSLKGNYAETWNFIKIDSNSLKRYTNFNLLFSDNAKNKLNCKKANNDLNMNF